MSVCIRAGSQKLLQEQFTFGDTHDEKSDLGVEKTKEDSFLHMGDKVVERKAIILLDSTQSEWGGFKSSNTDELLDWQEAATIHKSL